MPKKMEKNILIYSAAREYLDSIKPSGIDLDKYYLGDSRDFSSLNDIYIQFIRSAQNYQRMPNVIKFDERKDRIAALACGLDYQRIKDISAEDLYQTLRQEFNAGGVDNNFNSWHKWSKSFVDSARFISDFSDVDDFVEFVHRFDYNVSTRIALPLLISKKISGIGFALACDMLKELRFTNYPKPDVHMMDVFSALGLSENEPVSTFEAIIPEDLWLRVHELRKNKRRNSPTGRVSLFSGLLYCADCGSKLYFCASKSFTENQEHYVCSSYKSGRGPCSAHYIRNVVLERIVLESISDFVDFVRCYESLFVWMMELKREKSRIIDIKRMQRAIDNNRKRITEIDRMIQRIYEDNVNGKLSDERFMTMSGNYEAEQRSLKAETDDLEQELAEYEKRRTDLHLLLKTVRAQTSVNELTPELVNTLIKRIEIHAPEKINGKKTVAVDIFFTDIGLFTVPNAEEIKALKTEFSRKTA